MYLNLEDWVPTRLERGDFGRKFRARFTPTPSSKHSVKPFGGSAQTPKIIANEMHIIICDCCLVVMRLV
jgi:hypothetical protein